MLMCASLGLPEGWQVRNEWGSPADGTGATEGGNFCDTAHKPESREPA